MIKIELDIFVSAFMIVVLLLVLVRWIFYTYSGADGLRFTADRFQQCPYCAYVFTALDKSDIKICPQCRSLISENSSGETLKKDRTN